MDWNYIYQVQLNGCIQEGIKEDSKGRHLNISEILYLFSKKNKIIGASMQFISTFTYFEWYLCGCCRTFCSVLCVCFIKKSIIPNKSCLFLTQILLYLDWFPFYQYMTHTIILE